MRELQEMRVRSLGQEDTREKEMATHSSVLAWRIAWTEEPGGLQSQTGLSYHRLHFELPLVAQTVKNPPAVWEDLGSILGWEYPLEKG